MEQENEFESRLIWIRKLISGDHFAVWLQVEKRYAVIMCEVFAL